MFDVRRSLFFGTDVVKFHTSAASGQKNGQFDQRKKLCQTGVSYEHSARFVIVLVLVLVLVLEASEPLSVSRTRTSTSTSTIWKPCFGV